MRTINEYKIYIGTENTPNINKDEEFEDIVL